MKKIFFITGESSGDIHAGSLLTELYKMIPKEQLIVKAVGGNKLEEAGAEIFFNCKDLGSMGVTEVISKLSLYLNLEKEIILQLSTFLPHVLILVDFPGFNLRILKKVKEKFPEIKTVYYLPPQVWAWKEGRTKTLSKYCDLVLCGLPFEEEFHRKRGVNAYYVGNPIINELENYDREIIRSELEVSKDKKLIGIFPGSRKSEIDYMLPVLLKAANDLAKDFTNVMFFVSQAYTISNLDKTMNDLINKNNLQNIKSNIKILPPGNNHKLLCASDILWLTSGTVTLEAALYGNPLILGYKGNNINYLIYLLLRKTKLIGLPNIIAESEIVPELKQYKATPKNFYEITESWLNNPNKMTEVKSNLQILRGKLTERNASQEAALKIKDKFLPDYKVVTLK